MVVERWNLAAVCLAVAVIFKLYPLALVLLLVIACPRRFPAVSGCPGSADPCAVPTQHPDYVLRASMGCGMSVSAMGMRAAASCRRATAIETSGC